MRAKARRDPELAETICMTDTATVVDKYYGFREPEVAFIDKGDVLNDARGRGVLDKVPLPGKQFIGR